MDIVLTGFMFYGAFSIVLGLFLVGLLFKEPFPFAVAILSLIGLAFIGDWSSFSFIWNNPIISISVFFGYFVIGALYSLLKWTLFLRQNDTIERIKKQFNEFKEITRKVEFNNLFNKKIQANYNKIEFDEETKRVNELLKDFKFPSVEEFKMSSYNVITPIKYKSMISNWIFFWPASAIWTLTHDLVENIYNQLINVYRKISNNAIDKNLKD